MIKNKTAGPEAATLLLLVEETQMLNKCDSMQTMQGDSD